jgi:hypothetical protein
MDLCRHLWLVLLQPSAVRSTPIGNGCARIGAEEAESIADDSDWKDCEEYEEKRDSEESEDMEGVEGMVGAEEVVVGEGVGVAVGVDGEGAEQERRFWTAFVFLWKYLL